MRRIQILLILLPGWLLGQSISFDTYFIDRTMRIDYYHTGDAAEEEVTLDQIYEQGSWAGSLKNLIDPFNNGGYIYKVYDVFSNRLIYSFGFNSYFEEYQTTNPAIEGVSRTYHESALIPYPKSKVRFVIEKRDKHHIPYPVFSNTIDPESIDILREGVPEYATVLEIHKSGDPHEKVDFVWIAEGYTQDELSVFEEDVEHLKKLLFGMAPYKKHKRKFNIHGVFKPSMDSGIDEPRQGVYRRTAVDASFNALHLERYVLTENNKAYRDLAAHVPYDGLYILVNSDRYGGGGIYRFFGITTTHDVRSDGVFLHELGHSFAGLADEYYTSDVAYNDFYPPGVEPLEPNITALLDPDNVKWKALLSPGIEIPTNYGKESFDSLTAERNTIRKQIREKLEAMEKAGSSEEEITVVTDSFQENLEEIRNRLSELQDEFASLEGKVGVFEGAGYSATGLYRPQLDCLMKSTSRDYFCRVCQVAIERMIRFYSE